VASSLVDESEESSSHSVYGNGVQTEFEGKIHERGRISELRPSRELKRAVTDHRSSQQAVGLEDADAEGNPNASVGRGGWKPFASFVVEFQAREVEGRTEERRTTVHYMEADKGKTWSGTEGERLCQWMLSQLGEVAQRRAESEEELPVKARGAAALPVTVEIAQIRAFQPPQAGAPIGIGEVGRPFLGFARGNESLAFEASFELTGLGAVEVTKEQRTYRAQFYAGDMSTDATIHLGDTEPDILIENKLSYTALLPKAILAPGMYRVQVLVKVQGLPPILGCLEVPLLQVV
jgi:hypothetical protein